MKTARNLIIQRDIGRLLRTGLLILAIALQGYLTQVHHHDYAAATVAAATGAGNTSDSPVPPLDSDGRDHHCFICHLAGLGAIAVPPPAVAFSATPVSLVVYRDGADSLAVHHAPAAYSSRAPPSLFLSA